MHRKRFVGAMVAALAGVASAGLCHAQVVISQVFGVPTGGNGGSTYAYEVDYIELFNRGTTPVDMTGWSVQAEWLGDWEVIPLSVTLQPGQFFLIQVYERQPGTTNTGAPLPTPDLIAQAAGGGNNPDSTWLSGSQGAVALMNNTATIPSDSCPDGDPATMDLVSWGSTILTCGTAMTNAPSQTNFQSLQRRNGGCTDTNSSVADFELKPANPRNSTLVYPFYSTVNATPTPPLGVTKFTASISPFVCGATATLVSATANLTSVGGSAAAALADGGLNGDVTAGDGTFSLNYTLPGAVVAGQYPITITLTDAGANVRTVDALLNVAIDGDACQTARLVTLPFTDAYTTTDYTDDNLIVPCRSVTSPTVSRYGVWYRFPAGVTDRVVRVTKTSTLFNFSLYTGSCGALTIVDCDDSNSQANWKLAAGVNYYMLSMYDNSNTPTVNPTLVFEEITPPPNDTCSGAIDLASQPNPFTDTTFPFQTSTADVDSSCDSTPLVTRRGVWYTYLPAVDTILKTLQTVSGLTVTSSVWTGTCPFGLTPFLCTPPTSQTGPSSYYLPAGQRYYILLGINSSAQPGTSNTAWSNTFTLQTPPVNDLCTNATGLGTLSSPVSDSVVLSNASADTTVCGSATFGVWYTFTASSKGALRMTEASSIDVSWAVVSGCNSGTQLLCTTTDTDQYVDMTPGQQVWILLYTSSTTATAATPTFSFIPQLANDVCAGAVDLSAQSMPFATQPDVRGSTVHDMDIGPCTTMSSSSYAIWYTYTASASGLFTVADTSSDNVDIGVWEVGNPADPCNTMGTQIGCVADTNDAGVFSVVAGHSYVILLGSQPGASGPVRPAGAYNLTFNFTQPYPNDECSGATIIGPLPYQPGNIASWLASSGPRVSCEVVAATVHNNTLWYTYTPPTDETITIWDSSTTKSLAIALYRDSCPPGGTEEACGNNDVSFNLLAGHTYFIVVGLNLVSPDGPSGLYRLNFVHSQTFTNDTCPTAVNLTQFPDTRIVDATTATADGPTAVQTGCNTGTPTVMSQSYWYKIKTVTGGSLTGTIEPDYARADSGVAAVYLSADGTCNTLGGTPVWCGVDPLTPPATPINVNASLADNSTYYLILGNTAATVSTDFVWSIDLQYSGTVEGGVCCRGATCTTTITSQAACSGSLAGGVLAGASFVTTSPTCNVPGNTVTPCCYADYNKVNSISIQDIFDYLNDWFAGRPYAKIGGDGVSGTLAIQDIFDFLNAWFAGC